MTVADYAKLYEKSERTIMRYKAEGLPLDDEQAMRQIIGLKHSRLGTSKLFAKPAVTSVPTQRDEAAVEYVNVPQMFAELQKASSDLISVHFECVHLGWHDEALRARLKPIFDITRPYIEEPED
jgi:hypothetical protein